MLFNLTIALAAFLLFQIQLITAKWILPWFGGSPSVWTTCMLFYQVVLLLGYVYAHLIVVRTDSRKQSLIHMGLLACSALLIALTTALWNQPILPNQQWKPQGSNAPIPAILQLLGVSIGVPFLLLSSTSPLLQKWVSLDTRTAPYRLYALSNIGSLVALVTYPFVIEPNISLRMQSILWTIGYGFFSACSLLCAVRFKKAILPIRAETDKRTDPTEQPYWLWISLSACGSLLLLSTTNQICRDIAVIPFLWVLPLTIYLLTFILCFETEKAYSRLIFQIILVPLIVLTYFILSNGVDVPILHQVIVFSAILFVTCMICHGELYRSRPRVEHLTAFYMCIAAGGALGGLFSGVLAPYVLNGFWEYHLGLWLTGFLMVAALLHDRNSWIHKGAGALRVLQIAAGLAALAFLLLQQIVQDVQGSVFSKRNFYGVLNVVKEDEGTRSENYSLRHGRIRHGYQFTNPKRRMTPTSYYGVNSGLGLAIESLRNLKRPLKIGIVGLGVGTIAAYGNSGDVLRFYEIDGDVAALAESKHNYFDYLRNTPAAVQIVLGDGRISLEREPAPQQFDLLAIDAFNSDSIPAHLLTKEAMEVYLKHLKRPFGILALHISNRFIDLRPVVFGLGRQFGLQAAEIDAKAVKDVELASTWMLLMFEMPPALFRTDADKTIVWTDDYHSIFPLLQWTKD